MKTYFAYVRVSTVKQGEHGSSLQEQRSAIEAYALRQGLTIAGWFEEMETAAKLGRRMFNKLMGELEREKAAGVIIHKIDRSARNLKDWARLGELMDRGIEVHFAHDNLDLNTRGGRLSADIQAVIAADFIRNLRDEVRKGFYGRLKQGFYPLPAPPGYLNCGRAKRKEIDPIQGPLVRQAFDLYATATYSLLTLRAEMFRRGLRTKSGKPLSRQVLANILRNPFYIGLIRIRRTNEVFAGLQQPLISKAIFERVQAVLDGRVFARTQTHNFLFKRMIKCAQCDRSLTGERQKGHVYYRCHGQDCRGVSLSEDYLHEVVRLNLSFLQLQPEDLGDFRDLVRSLINEEGTGEDERIARVARDLAQIEDRLHRLTDAFLDGSIDKDAYDERKSALLMERQGLRDVQKTGAAEPFWEGVLKKFELGNTALQGYDSGTLEENRELLKSVSSNLLAEGKEPVFPMFSPFAELREWCFSHYGAPSHTEVRKEGTICASRISGGPYQTKVRTGAKAESNMQAFLISLATKSRSNDASTGKGMGRALA